MTEAERFPNQLVAELAKDAPGPRLELVANLGVNGYTSADVIRDELPALAGLVPAVVTLCIGVNDVVQGVPVERYAVQVGSILDELLGRLTPVRIVTLAVPDYTVTPAGADYGEPAVQATRIRAVNRRMSVLTAARGIAFVDISDIALAAATDRSLVAPDGLHPSGRQYARWVSRLAPVVRRGIES